MALPPNLTGAFNGAVNPDGTRRVPFGFVTPQPQAQPQPQPSAPSNLPSTINLARGVATGALNANGTPRQAFGFPLPPADNARSADVTPAPTTTDTGVTGSTTTTGTSGYRDPMAAAYYGSVVNQLRGMLDAIPTQEEQGRTTITNNANLALDRANQAQGQTLSKIGTQRVQADKNKVISLDDIDQNVANTVNSFRRLVAGGHAGNSAFANEFVPVATAREGSKQRQDVFNSYGQDMGALDTAEKDATTAYNNNVTDINSKKNSDLLDFLTQLSAQRDNLNQSAAQAAFYQQEAQGGDAASASAAVAPFQTDTATRVAALKSLFSQFANPTYAVNPVNVNIPDLSNYTKDPLAARLSSDNPGTPLAYLPYLPVIKKQPATA